jgi:gluconolactonase
MRSFGVLIGLLAGACGGSGTETGDESSGGTGPGSTSGVTSSGSTGDTTGTPTSGEPGTTSSSSSGGEMPTTTGETTTVAMTSEGGSESSTGTVAPPASLEEVVDGEPEAIREALMFPEGPVWSVDGGYLLFSDIPANTIYRWTENGGSEAFISPSGNSNGLIFDAMGRLLAAEHGNRRISRRVIGEMAATTVVDNFEGQKLNSPNDLVMSTSGSIYFTDPPYGINMNQQELDFQGVFWIDPEGALTVLADDFDRPNGIALSPDESILYVDDTAKEHVRRFDVQPDGNAFGGEVFIDLQSDLPGNPDGMAVDEFGDLYVTGGGGVRVVTPEGTLLGTIEIPESATNCKFGGADGRSLFVTAPPRVYRVAMKVKGAGF